MTDSDFETHASPPVLPSERATTAAQGSVPAALPGPAPAAPAAEAERPDPSGRNGRPASSESADRSGPSDQADASDPAEPADAADPAEPADPADRNARPAGRGRARRRPRSSGSQDASAAPATSAAPAAPRAKAAGRDRKVHPVLQRLFELYPRMFGARFLPLKLGIFQDLLALHPDEFKRDDLKVALGLHARSTRYLEAVAAGEQRHDLNAVPVEPVAPEHVHHAIMEVFRRRQARTADDLRPALVNRLVAAIEASGLDREAYLASVRTQDEVATAALDEAFARIGEAAAKREALVRAFEASGSSVEQFADMYGMDRRTVTQALARSAAARPVPQT